MTLPPSLNGNGTGPNDGMARTSDVTTVRVQLSEEEMTHFLRWQIWGTAAARARQIKLLGWTCLLGLIGGYSLGVLMGDNTLLITLVLGVVMPLVTGLSRWQRAREVARAYRKHAPQVYAPATWTLREDGILVQSEEQTTVREWRSIREIYITHELLLFEVGEAISLVLPRRCFTTPAASQKFASVARELWEAARNRVTDPPTKADLDAALGPEQIEIRYEATFGDIYWLIRYATWRIFRRQPRRFVLVSAITLLAAGLFLLLLWMRGSSINPFLFVSGCLILLFVYLLLLLPYSQSRQLAKTPGIVGLHLLWMSPRGMVGYTPDTGITRTEWSAFTELRRVGEYLLFERDQSVQSGLPLRGQDSATIDRIIAWQAAAVEAAPIPEQTARPSPPG